MSRCSVVSNSLQPHGLQPARLLWPWDSPGKNTGVGVHAGSPNPRIKPRSLTLQVDSLPSEPPGKSTNTGVGSLALLQGIFTTQESNQGLLHCRQFFTNWVIREAQNIGKCSNMSKNDVLRQVLGVYHILQIYGHGSSMKLWKGEGNCLGGKREQRTSELLRLWNSISESPGTSWTSKNRT